MICWKFERHKINGRWATCKESIGQLIPKCHGELEC
ncbi:hypothetical protein GYH30_033660 [Glycine max]|nr:hypothetical protein GYH30_033660 [Glycine max]